MDLHSWLNGGSWSQVETAPSSTLQRDQQVSSASSIVWTDHSDEHSEYFEEEDQDPLPDEAPFWDPIFDLSLDESELPYYITPSLVVHQLLISM
jgi:hypothetical protein